MIRFRLTLDDGSIVTGPIQGAGGIISNLRQLECAIRQAVDGLDTGLYMPQPGYCRVYPEYRFDGSGQPIDVDLCRVARVEYA